MTNLTTASEYDDSLPTRVLPDTDPRDVDALENLVESAAEPPARDKLPTEPVTPAINPMPLTRLHTGTSVIGMDWAPVLLLPADPYRLALQLWVVSDTAADFIRLADDAGKIQSKQTSALVYAKQDIAFPCGYTGPVWVSCPDAIGPVTVTFTAVTK